MDASCTSLRVSDSSFSKAEGATILRVVADHMEMICTVARYTVEYVVLYESYFQVC